MTKTRFYLYPGSRLDLSELRCAVYAWLLAERDGGEFICLSLHGDPAGQHSENIRWLGLRSHLPDAPRDTSASGLQDSWSSWTNRLVQSGQAYPCYCTPEEIRNSPDSRDGYDGGKCRGLTEAQKEQFESEGRKHVIRFLPSGAPADMTDPVLGALSAQPSEIRDPVLLDADNRPSDLLAETVMDAVHGVTRAFRESRHLARSYAQTLLARALDLPRPEFVHLPSVLKADLSLSDFRKEGYCPDAVLNCVAILGWTHPEGRVILDRKELVRAFDPAGISPEPVYTDPVLRKWIAKHHLVNMPVDDLCALAAEYWKESGRELPGTDFLKGFLELVRGVCSTLTDAGEHLSYFVSDEYPVREDAAKILKKPESARALGQFRDMLVGETRDLSEPVFQELQIRMGRDLAIRGKNLFLPLRAALSGRTDGPEIYYLIPVIGKERTVLRINRVLENLS